MSTIAILGSGFGLYGYLPALISLGHRIALPERYRLRFEARTELKEFAHQVEWAKDEFSALQISSGAVLALCPEMQCQWLATCLSQPQLERLFLEKPLAPNPAAATALQQVLNRSGKVIRIAYLFRYLDWVNRLKESLTQKTGGSLRLRWHFRAHHFSQELATWKREAQQGGGPLRFYGIHVLALLAELGYTSVFQDSLRRGDSPEASRWNADFVGANLPNFRVEIDTNSPNNEFSVVNEQFGRGSTVVHSSSPFPERPEANIPGRLDSRVSLLERLCHSAWADPILVPEFYERTIKLWKEAELAAPAWRAAA